MLVESLLWLGFTFGITAMFFYAAIRNTPESSRVDRECHCKTAR